MNLYVHEVIYKWHFICICNIGTHFVLCLHNIKASHIKNLCLCMCICHQNFGSSQGMLCLCSVCAVCALQHVHCNLQWYQVPVPGTDIGRPTTQDDNTVVLFIYIQYS